MRITEFLTEGELSGIKGVGKKAVNWVKSKMPGYAGSKGAGELESRNIARSDLNKFSNWLGKSGIGWEQVSPKTMVKFFNNPELPIALTANKQDPNSSEPFGTDGKNEVQKILLSFAQNKNSQNAIKSQQNSQNASASQQNSQNASAFQQPNTATNKNVNFNTLQNTVAKSPLSKNQLQQLRQTIDKRVPPSVQ